MWSQKNNTMNLYIKQKFLDTIKRAESTEDRDGLHVEHVVGKGREGVGTS